MSVGEKRGGGGQRCYCSTEERCGLTDDRRDEDKSDDEVAQHTERRFSTFTILESRRVIRQNLPSSSVFPSPHILIPSSLKPGQRIQPPPPPLLPPKV